MLKKMESRVLIVFCGILCYGVFLYLAWNITLLIPGDKLWSIFSNIYTINIHNNIVDLIDIIHISLGFPLLFYGGYRMPKISHIIFNVHNRETRKPKELLTEGYYGKVRHPMYASFMFINLGLLFSLRSKILNLISFILLFVFALNGIIEEKIVLMPRFNKEYKGYANQVKARYFTKATGSYVTLLIILSILGLFF